MNATVVPAAQITAGTKIVTVGNHGSKAGYSYYGTTVYVATVRKRDGKLVWVKDCEINDSTAGMSGKVTQRAKDYAAANSMSYAARIRQYQECN